MKITPGGSTSRLMVAAAMTLVAATTPQAADAQTRSNDISVDFDSTPRKKLDLRFATRLGITEDDWREESGGRLRSRFNLEARLPDILAAARNGAPDAMSLAAMVLVVAKNDESKRQALDWAQRGSEQGEPRSMALLGGMYLFGIGVARDPARGIPLVREADAAGILDGTTFLGTAQYIGAGTPKDVRTAYGTLKYAAENGHNSSALFNYAKIMLEPEIGGSAIESTALVKQAALQGLPEAELEYGWRLARGIGTERDLNAAGSWFDKGISRGECQATVIKGQMLFDSDQIALARPLLRNAVANGTGCNQKQIASANLTLGYLAAQDGDLQLARTLYQRSADGGNDKAPEFLAFTDRRIAEAARPKLADVSVPRPPSPTVAPRKSAVLAVAPGGPSISDILKAHAGAHVRFGGFTTSTPGEVAYLSPFGGVMYYRQRDVNRMTCTRKSASIYRCSYTVTVRQVAASDSMLGQLGSMFVPPSTGAWTFDYVRTGNGKWQSPQLDESIAADYRASPPSRGDGRNELFEHQEELRKQWKNTQEWIDTLKR